MWSPNPNAHSHTRSPSTTAPTHSSSADRLVSSVLSQSLLSSASHGAAPSPTRYRGTSCGGACSLKRTLPAAMSSADRGLLEAFRGVIDSQKTDAAVRKQLRAMIVEALT